MADFNVTGLDHVNITAPQELIDETASWYRDTLGLSDVEKPEGTRAGGAWLRAGDQEIHISVDEHNPPKAAHFGVVVDDLDAAIGRLRAAGCHIEQAGEIPGRHRCYTRDPAGNRIEVVRFDEGGGPPDA